MIIKRAIKRFFLTLMWLGVAAVMATVITAAMRSQQKVVCRGYSIQIQGAQKDKLFTSEKEIEKLLKVATHGEVKGQSKAGFNLPAMEELLEQSAWVYNAEIYFDNNDILHVKVMERKPLARIFTHTGESFYIDETGRHIPLSDKITVDVPVFTGYANKSIMKEADSSFLQNIIATASFINSDSFWTAQVAQVDIESRGTDSWNMLMIPVVGHHKVNLGDGSDIASKFHRLFLFYSQVSKRKGFDKYPRIDVQYNGQVVAMKESNTRIDSLQLRKNIEELLLQSRKTNDLIEEMPVVIPGNILKRDTAFRQAPDYAEDAAEDTTALMPAAAFIAAKATEPKKEIVVKPAAPKPAVDVKKVVPEKKKTPTTTVAAKATKTVRPVLKNEKEEKKATPVKTEKQAHPATTKSTTTKQAVVKPAANKKTVTPAKAKEDKKSAAAKPPSTTKAKPKATTKPVTTSKKPAQNTTHTKKN